MITEENLIWEEGTKRYEVDHCQHSKEVFCEGLSKCKLCGVLIEDEKTN